jgi:hypothetical protein
MDVNAFGATLEAIAGALDAGKIAFALTKLSTELACLRQRLHAPGWRVACEALDRHPIMTLLMEDPIIRHARATPSIGCAPPGLIELLVEGPERDVANHAASPLGRALSAETRNMALLRGLAERRRGTLRWINAQHEFAQAGTGCRHIVLGSGAMVARMVRTVGGAQRAATAGPLERPSAFLLAEMVDGLPVARLLDLMRVLPSLLVPRGQLLIGAIASDAPDLAWLEAVLTWQPIVRNERILSQLAGLALGPQVEAACWRDATRTIVFTEITCKTRTAGTRHQPRVAARRESVGH